LTTPGAEELGRLLKQIVEKAGLSAAEVGRRIGRSESAMSRYINGKGQGPPKPSLVREIATACGASPSDVEDAVRLAEDLVNPRVVLLRPGSATSQRRWRDAEAETELVLDFAGLIVPGLLQTPAYSRAVFQAGGQDEVTAAANAEDRIGRQSRLDDPAHRFVEVMTEGALRWHVLSPRVMAEQCDVIAARARSDSSGRVRVGVIPWTRAGRVFPMTNFTVYDDRVAIVGTDFGTAYITHPRDVAGYAAQHSELAELAVWGKDAAREVDRIGDEYRAIT
jgi:transcriptional regulator with XRE-family HTH domain